MNYSQFLNMIPEFYLVIILIVVFFADFCLHKSEKKHDILFAVTVALMAVLPFRIALLSEPSGSSISSQWNSGTTANTSGSVSAKSTVQDEAQSPCGSTRPKSARPPRHGKGGVQL